LAKGEFLQTPEIRQPLARRNIIGLDGASLEAANQHPFPSQLHTAIRSFTLILKYLYADERRAATQIALFSLIRRL
jgi:hypothetical protein